MSEPNQEKLARELDKQKLALEARPADLPEGGAEPPRGALPALFRALREAGAEARAAVWPALGARLPDGPLLEPTLALARDTAEEAALVGAWLAGGWCAHQQVAALHAATGADARRTVEWVGALTGDLPWDPTDAALGAGLEQTQRALRELIRLRLASPAKRRDRTSARLARGAVLALAKLAPGDAEVAATFAQVVAAETRRAGKDEPELALAALEALGAAPPFERLRLLAPLGRGIERAKVATRLEDALAAAAAEVGAGPEDRTDLLARTGGLEPDGWVRVPLDDGGEAKLRIAADGTLEQTVALDPGGPPCAVTPLGAGPRLGSADARSIEAAARELTQARGDLARRLEQALVTGRGWPVRLWRATFQAGHPLWADLAPRVLWELRGPSGPTAFELGPAPEAVLGDAVDLDAAGAEARIGLAHPARLEREELDLWRERALERALKQDPAERRRPEPFPQRFRAVGPDEAIDATTARFVGRQAHKQAAGDMARRSGWAGFPLLGTGPWDLTRPLHGGARVRLTVEDAPLEVTKLPPARRPSLTGERELDEDAAFGPSRNPKDKGKRPPPEAAPRVKLGALELSSGADAVARAELRLDLETLTDGLATVDELWLRVWQQRKWKDAKESWREAVLRYRVASFAPVDVRKAVLAALAKARGVAARLEDRFAIVGQFVVELGTGLVHQGATKEHLPQWKVDELLAKQELPPPALPFEPAADPASAEVIARVLGLAAL